MQGAILWDLDGVLADTGEAHLAAWRALFAERGESITPEQFAETFGMANLPILRLRYGAGPSDQELATMGLRKEELYRQFVEGNVVALLGVLALLAAAQERGYRQAVASSGEMANIVTVIDALGIANYFDALVSGAFLPRSKPDPAIFVQAAGALGVPPARCLVIEDGTVGVEAARRAGMACLAVTTTHPREHLQGADLIVDSLCEISPQMLAALVERG